MHHSGPVQPYSFSEFTLSVQSNVDVCSVMVEFPSKLTKATRGCIYTSLILSVGLILLLEALIAQTSFAQMRYKCKHFAKNFLCMHRLG